MSTTRKPNPTNATKPTRTGVAPLDAAVETPNPPTKSAAATRKRILSVAANLFAEKGYANTTVRDIAAGLGISNPSLYYHFPSKADILLELIAEPLACVERAVVAAMQLEGEARTRCILGGLLDSIELHRGLTVTLVQGSPSGRPQGFEHFEADMNAQILAMLKPSIAPDFPEMRVTMGIAAITGAVVNLVSRTPDPDSFITELRHMREPLLQIVLGILQNPTVQRNT
jgi:AcrR family transcriptional regulator